MINLLEVGVDASTLLGVLNLFVLAVAGYISYRAYKLQNMIQNPGSVEVRISALEERIARHEQTINEINVRLAQISNDITWLKNYLVQRDSQGRSE